jgi:hypothetical protein
MHKKADTWIEGNTKDIRCAVLCPPLTYGLAGNQKRFSVRIRLLLWRSPACSIIPELATLCNWSVHAIHFEDPIVRRHKRAILCNAVPTAGCQSPVMSSCPVQMARLNHGDLIGEPLHHLQNKESCNRRPRQVHVGLRTCA